LTNAQAAREIIDEAKGLLQQDLQAMGFGIVVQKEATDQRENHPSYSETDSDDDGDDDDMTHGKEMDICVPKSSSTITFPSLLDDKNIHLRNAYVDGKHICSEFILMIEHKETMAISCFTRRSTKPSSGDARSTESVV
jgi:hypothetical protein